MAKRSKSSLTGIFLIIEAVMALNFLALVTLVAGQYFSKKIDQNDLLGILRVLKGEHHYTLDNTEIHEYKELLKDREARRKKQEEQTGTGEASVIAPQRSIELIKIQQENAQVLRDEIESLEARLTGLRDEVQSLRDQRITERERLLKIKREEVKTELSENRAKLQKTLSGMDAEEIGRYLAGTIKNSGQAFEAARVLRDLVNPGLAAEILTEMDAGDVQQILPLMEDKYAARQPRDIIQEMTLDKKTPQEIVEHLRCMPVSKAFGVYLLLEPEIKGQVARLLQEDQ